MSNTLCTVGSSIEIKGRVSGSGSLVIAGVVEGEISVEQDLTVEAGGRVVADVAARTVTVRGELTGDVTATERVSVEAGAKLVGNIRAPRLAIADGATVRGAIDMDIPSPSGGAGGK
ncbi:MAG: cytoskeletal protein CcmA (bactofilin family) [Bradymonadia bacterium]|jgi:cytoskeletal protein CcmA (bactofilin family)